MPASLDGSRALIEARPGHQMESVKEIRDHLDYLITSGAALPELRQRSNARYPGDSRTARKRASKAWLTQTTEYRRLRHWGKFRRAIMLGAVVLGRQFIVDIEQDGLLLADGIPLQEFSTCLRDLARQIAATNDPAFVHLGDRVRTYRAFNELSLTIHVRGEKARGLLAERPFPYGRTLLAFTDLAFLRQQFHFEEAGKEFKELFDEFGSAELLAEAASAVIALANEYRPLESADFTLPLIGIDVSEEFLSVLRYGAAISQGRQIGKQISVLNYELARVHSVTRTVYRLCAPDAEREYALRLGYIRGEIGRTASPLRVSEGSGPLISMLAATKDLLDRWPQLAELTDPETPRRRVRLHLPLFPKLYEMLAHTRFYEDAIREEGLGQELELPMRVAGASWPLVASLDLNTFQKAWRSLEFFALLDITAIRRYESDPVVLHNSLMRVSREADMVELLQVVGLSPDQVRAFLDLVAADVRRLGHYDMQYRPFLRVNQSTFRIDDKEQTTRPEIVHASAVVVSSNVTINIQRAHGIRIKTNADAFVAVAEALLKRVFKNVRANVPVKLGEDRTDVDIMILSERILYLIECKHSITATGAHELRDLWRDINHGVYQLNLAIEILRTRLDNYLGGLFPGTTKAKAIQLRIQPCVLCSHRVFSGLSVEGIPIRDFASLALICGDGVVATGLEDDSGHVVMQRYRLRANDNATQEDIDEYLSPHSRFFGMFRPFVREYDRLDRLFGGSIVLAHNTFLHYFTQEDWAAHLERIGAVAVSPESYPVEKLRPISINRSTDQDPELEGPPTV
jgi:hypothetical protein